MHSNNNCIQILVVISVSSNHIRIEPNPNSAMLAICYVSYARNFIFLPIDICISSSLSISPYLYSVASSITNKTQGISRHSGIMPSRRQLWYGRIHRDKAAQGYAHLRMPEMERSQMHLLAQFSQRMIHSLKQQNTCISPPRVSIMQRRCWKTTVESLATSPQVEPRSSKNQGI